MPTTPPNDPPIREILVATDFSPHARQAARVARDLANQFHARLHLLHVARDDGDRPAATAELSRLVTDLPLPAAVTVVAVGSPSQEIVRYAQRARVDLIVIGTHGRTGLARLLHGSVAEAVVRTASCEVLAIKLPEELGLPAATPAPVAAAPVAAAPRCLLCARPSEGSICGLCQARIQGEAVERKRRELGSRT